MRKSTSLHIKTDPCFCKVAKIHCVLYHSQLESSVGKTAEADRVRDPWPRLSDEEPARGPVHG